MCRRMAHELAHQRLCHAELHVAVDMGVVGIVDLRDQHLESRLEDQGVQMRGTIGVPALRLEQADMNLRGKFTTDADGRFAFRSVMMVGYPIPTNGVVGRLLEAQNRHPYRPAHLHALIFKPGFKVLISQVYDPNDPHIDSDVQFGVTQALIGKFLRHETAHPTAPDVSAPWYSLDHTYRLEVGEAVLPRPPIK